MHVEEAHIWKQPWHLTSMKKLFGDWTRRLVLCFCFSSSAGGWSRSMSLERTCMGSITVNIDNHLRCTMNRQLPAHNAK